MRTAGTDDDEEVVEGEVGWGVYLGYLSASGSVWFWVVVFLGYCTVQATQGGGEYWLSRWADRAVLAEDCVQLYDSLPGRGTAAAISTAQASFYETCGTSVSDTAVNTGRELGVYAIFTVGTLLLLCFAASVAGIAYTSAAKALWVRLWHRLLRAPLAFHDASRAGRFSGVCTRDIFICDETLGTNWNIYLYTIATSLGMFALVCIIVPPFLALAIPAGILYCALLSYYRRTSRAMQRIEAVQRAPAYALLSEALAGVAPLRSAHLIRKYVKAMARRVDRRSAVLYHLMSANCWLGLSMEALSSAIVAFAAFASVGFAISGSLTAGAAGLVVTNAIMVTGLLAGGVQTATQLEVEMNAVERIRGVSEEATPEVQTLRLMGGSFEDDDSDDEGTSSPPEWPDAELEASADALTAKEELEMDAWPADSSVRFRRYWMRYRMDLPAVLRGVNLDIPAGSRLAVVGRTGSGKSSLAAALIRNPGPGCTAGSLLVGGRDVKTVPLARLRRHVALLPQEPWVLRGSVRENLGGDACVDSDAWALLRSLGLADAVRNLPVEIAGSGGGLDGKLSTAAWSRGQRQLLALARAVLRRPAILVLDEATASLDEASEKRLLAAADNHATAAHCTVISVVHRVAIALAHDAHDRQVAVLDAGRVAEVGPASELTARDGGAFARLVQAHSAG
ncbi:ABC transporter [Pseudoscourfieldia marina]